MKWWSHLKTINHHKWLVMKFCFRLGLFKQGLLHDLSKYSPTEFLVGAKYYQGTRSPHHAERAEKGYSAAWLHHKGRNKHHYEYWMDYSSHDGKGIIPVRMPDKYVVEMFIDRVAASKNYNKENYKDDMPLKYYDQGMASEFLHEDTRMKLEFLLRMLDEQGEEVMFDYIRKNLVGKKDYPKI